MIKNDIMSERGHFYGGQKESTHHFHPGHPGDQRKSGLAGPAVLPQPVCRATSASSFGSTSGPMRRKTGPSAGTAGGLYGRPQKRACCKMCSSYKDPSFREKRAPTGRPFFVGIRPFCRGNGLPRQCAHWLAMTGLCKTAILQQALFHNMAYSPTTAAQRGHSSA